MTGVLWNLDAWGITYEVQEMPDGGYAAFNQMIVWREMTKKESRK